MSAHESDHLPQNWRERGGVPAAASGYGHPEPGRSATGWYVLVLLTVAAAAAIWLSVENWRPGGLADQADEAADLRREYDDLRIYINDLSEQNDQMARQPRRNPLAAPERPVLQQNVFTRKRNFDRQRAANLARCGTQPTACARAQEERAEIEGTR
jgi:hypothetical protein